MELLTVKSGMTKGENALYVIVWSRLLADFNRGFKKLWLKSFDEGKSYIPKG